ncbi:MAG: aminoglycoside phosphotransferase family protein [Proteobacteria bacterium]|nr:aminoglycoside phosphotransferase family protein [Pseudomonadota bacterium]
MRRAARAIAAVHGLSVPAARRRDFRTEARTALRWARLIAKIRPGLAKRVQALSRGVVAELEHRMVVKAPVHNDFHLGNILVDDGQVTLIDFDQLVHGDPLYDVGRFLGALRIAALRVTGDPAGLAEAGDAFFDEYLRCTGEEVSRARLYEAAALLMSAAAPFRLQRKGWRQATVMLVDEVERALKLARRGARVSLAGAADRESPRLGNGDRWAYRRCGTGSCKRPASWC